MKRAPQGRYTREFRQEAVKLVLEENLSLPEAGRRLSLPPSTLGYWVKLYQPTFPIWLNIPLSKSSAFFKPLSICETLAVGMAIITP